MSRAARDEAALWINRALLHNQLKHQVHKIFPLGDIVAAHEATESMKHVGKVLIRIE